MQLDLQKLLEFEEELWRDKSRETRIKCDGTNSHFFYISTITHRRCIEISRIRNTDEVWVDDIKHIENTIIEHSKDICTSNNLVLKVTNLNVTGKVITEEENKKVTINVSLGEIHVTLFSMDPYKAPRLVVLTLSSINFFGIL